MSPNAGASCSGTLARAAHSGTADLAQRLRPLRAREVDLGRSGRGVTVRVRAHDDLARLLVAVDVGTRLELEAGVLGVRDRAGIDGLAGLRVRLAGERVLLALGVGHVLGERRR